MPKYIAKILKQIKNNKLLAPNRMPSNLSPAQWELVRTPAFKEWFGNWQYLLALNMLNSNTILELIGDSDLKLITNNAQRNKYIKSVMNDVYNKIGGVKIKGIAITKNGLKHTLRHATKEVLNAVYFIDEFLSTAIEIGYKNNNDPLDTSILRYWYYVNKIKYNDVEYGITFVAREQKNSNNILFYDLNLVEIKKPIANTPKTAPNHYWQYKDTHLDAIF